MRRRTRLAPSPTCDCDCIPAGRSSHTSASTAFSDTHGALDTDSPLTRSHCTAPSHTRPSSRVGRLLPTPNESIDWTMWPFSLPAGQRPPSAPTSTLGVWRPSSTTDSCQRRLLCAPDARGPTQHKTPPTHRRPVLSPPLPPNLAPPRLLYHRRRLRRRLLSALVVSRSLPHRASIALLPLRSFFVLRSHAEAGHSRCFARCLLGRALVRAADSCCLLVPCHHRLPSRLPSAQLRRHAAVRASSRAALCAATYRRFALLVSAVVLLVVLVFLVLVLGAVCGQLHAVPVVLQRHQRRSCRSWVVERRPIRSADLRRRINASQRVHTHWHPPRLSAVRVQLDARVHAERPARRRAGHQHRHNVVGGGWCRLHHRQRQCGVR